MGNPRDDFTHNYIRKVAFQECIIIICNYCQYTDTEKHNISKYKTLVNCNIIIKHTPTAITQILRKRNNFCQ